MRGSYGGRVWCTCIGGVVESVLHWEGVVGGCAVCIGGMVETILRWESVVYV